MPIPNSGFEIISLNSTNRKSARRPRVPLHKAGKIVYTEGQKKAAASGIPQDAPRRKIFRKEGYSMKYILVIGDGMADHPLDTLGGRTPLEASKKDAIDDLARHGVLGRDRKSVV